MEKWSLHIVGPLTFPSVCIHDKLNRFCFTCACVKKGVFVLTFPHTRETSDYKLTAADKNVDICSVFLQHTQNSRKSSQISSFKTPIRQQPVNCHRVLFSRPSSGVFLGEGRRGTALRRDWMRPTRNSSFLLWMCRLCQPRDNIKPWHAATLVVKV